jgi:gas vesicle protein
MEMFERDTDSSFSNGLLIGAALGALAALLFAPKTGREMRDTLTRETSRLKDNAYKAANDLRDKGTKLVDRAQKRASSAVQGSELRFGEGTESSNITS